MAIPKNINWQDWSTASFEKAEKEKKPILLSITATWCYWCHRQDKDGYNQSKVIELINKEFIPIRIDTDERPDINERYNMGGWPTVIVLTPKGTPIQGATYLPEQDLLNLLKQTLSIFKSAEAQINEQYLTALKERSIVETKSIKPADVLDSTQDFLITLRGNFDFHDQGFGGAPKFPQTPLLKFLYFHHLYTKDDVSLKLFLNTMKKMATSELFDKEEGGFFRYCVTEDWRQPHYEKMSADNAELLELYCYAYNITGDALYKDVIEKTVDYILCKWQGTETAGFYASTDADESYYQLSLADRKKQTHPFIDKRSFTDWNSMLSSALLLAAHVLEKTEDEPSSKDKALACIDYLLENNFKEDKVLHFADSKAPSHLLSDYVFLWKACINAYEFTFEKKYLDQAKKLKDLVFEKFYDEKRGAFTDSLAHASDIGELTRKVVPLPENAVIVTCLSKLAVLLEDESLNEQVRKIVDAVLARDVSNSVVSAGFMSSAFLAHHGLMQVKIADSSNKPSAGADQMIASLRSHYSNALVFTFIPGTETGKLKEFNLAEITAPTALVCRGKTCLAPVFDVVALNKVL